MGVLKRLSKTGRFYEKKWDFKRMQNKEFWKLEIHNQSVDYFPVGFSNGRKQKDLATKSYQFSTEDQDP